MKKVLIISTSLRNGSNSELLAKETEKGAKEAGHEVEFVSLKNKNIAFCKGCLACQKLGKCVIKDDANTITEKIKKSDVIVWATPVYYYEMAGQMKTVIDRANSLYSSNYKFREVYLITTSTEYSKTVADRVISGVQGWIDCFEDVKLKKTLSGGGAEGPNAAKNMPELLKKAYELGKNI